MSTTNLAVYCADVGSIANDKFGWARVCGDEKETGTDIEKLANRVANDLRCRRVALGFECPLFVPLHDKPEQSLCCRPGEGNRAWSASAGVSSLGAGLVQSAWLLSRIRELDCDRYPVFIRMEEFRLAATGLLVWEAFVTGKRLSTHEQDALVGAMAFIETWPAVRDDLQCEDLPVMSLIGLALLRTKWTDDLKFVSQKPLVVAPAAIRNPKLSGLDA